MTDEQDKAPIDLPGVGTVPDPQANNGEGADEQEPLAKSADAAAEAIQRALAGAKRGPQLSPCACGATDFNLMIELPQSSKVGRATCGACGTWGIDFLAPRTQDQNLISGAAAKAWNEAPRP